MGFSIKEDVPWGAVIFLVLFGVVLFYFICFQSYLSGWFLKSLARLALKGMDLQFSRFAFSFLSGHISIHNLNVIMTSMMLSIARIRARVNYWRKLPKFVKGEVQKPRLEVILDSVEVTLYNSGSNEQVKEFIEKFKNGVTTEEITQMLASQNVVPLDEQPLSTLYCLIFPISFKIHSLLITIGNPKLPSSLILAVEYVNGQYKVMPREGPTKHVSSKAIVELENFTLRSEPKLSVAEKPTSMRSLFRRSRQSYMILETRKMVVEMNQSMYGVFTPGENPSATRAVTEEPEFSIMVSFDPDDEKREKYKENDNTDYKCTKVVYGPYVDKIRGAVMRFFMPGMYTDPQLFPNDKKRAKYMHISMLLHKGMHIDMPFVDNNYLDQHLYLDFTDNSEINIYMPKFISDYNQNKMEVLCRMNDIKISTSISQKPVISGSVLECAMFQQYPEKWNGDTNLKVTLGFTDGVMNLAPYHIDFLAQLGSDWGGEYPFEDIVYDLNRHQGSIYNVTLSFCPFTFYGFSKADSPFEAIDEIDKHSHIRLEANAFDFKLTMPSTEWNPRDKDMTYTILMACPKLEFVEPVNDIHIARRGQYVYDTLAMRALMISGSYGWKPGQVGYVDNGMTMKLQSVTGMITIYAFQELLEVIRCYTGAKAAPVNVPVVPPLAPELVTTNHSGIIVHIDRLGVLIPIDLYDVSNCAEFHVFDLLLNIEGYYPFWHCDVNMETVKLKLPDTNYPYNRFYQNHFDVDTSEEDKMEDSLHINGIGIKIRNVASLEPNENSFNSVDISVGTIGGVISAPSLLTLLELVQNLAFEWSSEDVKEQIPFDIVTQYPISQMHVAVAATSLLVDFPGYALMYLYMPTGVVVYSDNLIDAIDHSVMHIKIPVLDVSLVCPNDEGEIKPIFKLVTFIDMIRQSSYPSVKVDQLEQSLMLRKVHAELGLFPFLDSNDFGDALDASERTEIYLPDAFKPSMDETYTLYEVYEPDPENDMNYELRVPKLAYESMQKYVPDDDLQFWMHEFMLARFYNRTYPSYQRRDVAHMSLEMPALSTSVGHSSPDDFIDRSATMHIVIPNDMVIQIAPAALTPLIGVMKMMSLKPDCQMMSAYTRRRCGEANARRDTASSMTTISIPKVSVVLADEIFNATVDVDAIQMLSQNDREGNSNMCLQVGGVVVGLAAADRVVEKLVSVLVPTISVISKDTDMVVKLSSDISISVSDSAMPTIYGAMANIMKSTSEMLSAEVKDVQSMFYDDLILDKLYEPVKKHYENTMYVIVKNPRIPVSINAEITALYDMNRRRKMENFVDQHMFAENPPEKSEKYSDYEEESFSTVASGSSSSSGVYSSTAGTVVHGAESARESVISYADPESSTVESANESSDSIEYVEIVKDSRTTVLPISIRITLNHDEDDNTEAVITLYPVVMQGRGNTTAVTAGIKSVDLNISPSILTFLGSVSGGAPSTPAAPASKAIEPVKQEEKKPKDKVFKGRVVVDNISMKFANIKGHVESISGSVSTEKDKLMAVVNIKDIQLGVDQLVNFIWRGLKFSMDQESRIGMLFIAPVEASVSFTLFTNPMGYLGLDMERKEPETGVDQTKKPAKPAPQPTSNGSSSGFIGKILDTVTMTFIMEQSSISIALGQDLNAVVTSPSILGVSMPQYDDEEDSHHLVMTSPMTLALTNVFSFEIPGFVLSGYYRTATNFLQSTMIIGKVDWTLTRDMIVKLLSITNYVLESMPKQKKSKKKAITHNTEQTEVQQQPSNSGLKFEVNVVTSEVLFNLNLNDVVSKIEISAVRCKVINDSTKFTWMVYKFTIGVDVNKMLITLIPKISGNSDMKQLTISKIDIEFPKDFVARLNTLKRYFNAMKSDAQRNKKLNGLFKEVKTGMQTAVEKKAGKLIEYSMHNTTEEDLDFPSIDTTKWEVIINNIGLKIALQDDGYFKAGIKNTIAILHIRKSPKHSERAYVALFEVDNFHVVFDTQEMISTSSSDAASSGQPTYHNDKVSSITCDLIRFDLSFFNNEFVIDSIVDKLLITLMPTLPYALTRLMSLLTTHNEPRKLSASRRAISRRSLSKFQSLRRISTPEPPEEQKHPEHGDVAAEEEEEIETPIQTRGSISFKLLNSSITLIPSSSIIPLDAIHVGVFVRNKAVNASLVVPNTIQISLRPTIVTGWILPFKDSMDKANEEKASRNTNPKMVQVVKTKTKKKGPKMDMTIVVAFHGVDLRLTCDQTKEPSRVNNNEKILSFIVGFRSVHVQSGTLNGITSVAIRDVYVCTDDSGIALFKLHSKDRLFELVIPEIDIIAKKHYARGRISTIDVIMSNKRIDDVSTFMESWITPVIAKLTKRKKKQAPRRTLSRQTTSPVLAKQRGPTKSKELFPVLYEDKKSCYMFTLDKVNVGLCYGTSSDGRMIKFEVCTIRAVMSSNFTNTSISSIGFYVNGELNGSVVLNSISAMKIETDDAFAGIASIKSIAIGLKDDGRDGLLFDTQFGQINVSARKYISNGAGASIIFMSLKSPTVVACAGSMPKLLGFIHNVIDPLSSKIMNIISPEDKEARARVVEEVKNVVAKTFIPTSRMMVMTEDFSVHLFKYFTHQGDSARISMQSLILDLDIGTVLEDSVKTFKRDLAFRTGLLMLEVNLYKSEKVINVPLLAIPDLDGTLSTSQVDKQVLYRFITEFKSPIEPNLTSVDPLNAIFSIISEFRKGISGQSNRDVVPQKTLKQPAAVKEEKKEEKKEPQYEFIPIEHVFNPIIGRAENIAAFLKFFKITSEHAIPSSIFEYLSLSLESLMCTIDPKITPSAAKQEPARK